MTVEQKIRDYIESELLWQGASEELDEDTPLIERRVIDSLGIVKLVSFVESEYGINVEDEEVLPRHFETIRALAAFVDAKRAAA